MNLSLDLAVSFPYLVSW